MEVIMDLIGSIKLIENTLDRRNSSQSKGMATPQSKRQNASQGKNPLPENQPMTVWDEIQLGRNIDTTA